MRPIFCLALAASVAGCSTGYTVQANDVLGAQRQFVGGENDPYIDAVDEDGHPVRINASHIESVDGVDFDIAAVGRPGGMRGEVAVEKDDLDQTVRTVGWLGIGVGALLGLAAVGALEGNDADTRAGVILGGGAAAMALAGTGLVFGAAFIPENEPRVGIGVAGRF